MRASTKKEQLAHERACGNAARMSFFNWSHVRSIVKTLQDATRRRIDGTLHRFLQGLT